MEKSWMWQYCSDQRTLAWRYFTKEQAFVPKCANCGQTFVTYNETVLELHLINEHSSILKEIIQEVESLWPQFDISNDKIKCKTCDITFNILEVYGLHHHLLYHERNKWMQENFELDDIFGAILVFDDGTQESANVDTISDRESIIKELSSNVQSSWIWHCCDRQSLIWRYFIKVQMVFPICEICGVYFFTYNEYTLEEHVQNKHPPILKEIHEEVETIWPQFDISNNQMKCKVCNETFNIFKVHAIQQHWLDHDKHEGTQDNNERNNVITTMEPPPAQDNSAGISHETATHSQAGITEKASNGTEEVTERTNTIIAPSAEENNAYPFRDTGVFSPTFESIFYDLGEF